ncbi:cellular nucleic acid-binding protein homolog [Aricia agestis]|uniref:cellular nucleic acid-binding protein homolog n=1 Tax=Aricia agestis TaxID=91739 RepID=UPI001C206496|nr:cellular nucleic acid-binding protein homolog [Aricia agestis]
MLPRRRLPGHRHLDGQNHGRPQGRTERVAPCPHGCRQEVSNFWAAAGSGKWVLAKVVLLASRPKRCYRCLDTGHLAPSCQFPVDRSGNCFRCGKPGHKAANCAEEPSCFFCAELDRESNNVLGSNGCFTAASKSPSSRRKHKARPRKRPGANKAGASETVPAMEVEA